MLQEIVTIFPSKIDYMVRQVNKLVKYVSVSKIIERYLATNFIGNLLPTDFTYAQLITLNQSDSCNKGRCIPRPATYRREVLPTRWLAGPKGEVKGN